MTYPNRLLPFFSTLILGLMALPLTAQTEMIWTLRSLKTSPSNRSYMGMAYSLARGKTLLFGGWDKGSLCLGDTWEYNGNDWAQLHPKTNPPARCCHRIVYDFKRNRMVLFGGGSGTKANLDLADTWEWDGKDWLNCTPTTPSPSPRREYDMAYDQTRGKVVLFGGGHLSLGTPRYNDTWEWDGVKWTQMIPTLSPSPRWCHTLVTDPLGGIMLFGGKDTTLRNDTWRWDGRVWTKLSPTVRPPARWSHRATFDLIRRRSIIHGCRTLPLPYTWEWNGKDWLKSFAKNTPPTNESFGFTFDLLRNRTIRFGGYQSGANTWEYSPYPVAVYQAFGNSCNATWGTPILQPDLRQLPKSGQAYSQVIEPVTSNTTGIGFLGFSNTNFGLLTLPFDLSGCGMPNCYLYTKPVLSFPLKAIGTKASWLLPLPADTIFLGHTFYQQGFLLAPGTNKLGLVSTNAIKSTIGY